MSSVFPYLRYKCLQIHTLFVVDLTLKDVERFRHGLFCEHMKALNSLKAMKTWQTNAKTINDQHVMNESVLSLYYTDLKLNYWDKYNKPEYQNGKDESNKQCLNLFSRKQVYVLLLCNLDRSLYIDDYDIFEKATELSVNTCEENSKAIELYINADDNNTCIELISIKSCRLEF